MSIPIVARRLVAGALFVASSAFAAPAGELDASFGDNGRLAVTLTYSSLGVAVAQQPDGKLLVGGASFSESNGSDFAVVRLNADGSRDESFGAGGDGVVMIDFFQGDDQAMKFLVQPDGAILLAGWSFDTGYDMALARLNPDGSLDSGFGDGGKVALDLGGADEQVSGMVVQGDGRIVVAGHTDADGQYDIALARLNLDGTLDTSFGSAGSTIVEIQSTGEQAYSLTRQPDGKLIACGLSGPFGYDATDGAMLAVRVNEDGLLDVAYGTDGVAIVQTPTVMGQAKGCAALQDGSGATILAGVDGDSDANLALARLDAGGVPDPAFGTAGLASMDLGGWELGESIVSLDDGMIVVAGLTFSYFGDIFLARIDAGTGELDATFGNEGITVVDFGEGSLPSASFSYPYSGFGLIRQSDGKLVAVGTRDNFGLGPSAIAVARIDPLGTGNVGVVGFAETVFLVAEGTADAVLTLRRTGGSAGEITIAYAFESATAQSPADFSATEGTVTWADGETTNKSITVAIADDETVESSEDFFVILSNTATDGLALAATDATVTIEDDDQSDGGGGGGGDGGGGGGGGGGLDWLVVWMVSVLAWLRSRGPVPESAHRPTAFPASGTCPLRARR